jgi:nucleoside-triphosphatase THEP1
MSDAQLFIVTGERGAGKTTCCARLIELARSGGWQIAGVLSPAVIVAGVKTGIDVIDLRSGQRRHLATLNLEAQAPHDLHWRFDPEALDWGNTVLQAATPCEVLIVDELGVLEFERGQGWLAGLRAIDAGDYRWGVVVIRPELLNAAQQRWPQAQRIDIQHREQANAAADTIWQIVSGELKEST